MSDPHINNQSWDKIQTLYKTLSDIVQITSEIILMGLFCRQLIKNSKNIYVVRDHIRGCMLGNMEEAYISYAIFMCFKYVKFVWLTS